MFDVEKSFKLRFEHVVYGPFETSKWRSPIVSWVHVRLHSMVIIKPSHMRKIA